MREKDWLCAWFYSPFQQSILAVLQKVKSQQWSSLALVNNTLIVFIKKTRILGFFVLEEKTYVVELNGIVDYWQIVLHYSGRNLCLQFLWKAQRNKKEQK